MPPDLQFVTVGTMMEELCRGLGHGHRKLVENSSTELGTLIVRSADIVVDFELTSQATSRKDGLGITGPTLGAKTLTLAATSSSSQTQDRALNKASIKLSVVSVADAKPALPNAENTRAEVDKLRDVMDRLRAVLVKIRLPREVTERIQVALAHADTHLTNGKVAEARDILLNLFLEMAAVRAEN